MSQTYRCYFVGKDGHYIGREEVESPTPAEAIETSIALLTKRPALPACTGFELWDGDNKRIHTHAYPK